MYNLFEFAKLFSVRSTRPQSHGNGKVDIIGFEWKEEGEISFLALLCSNDQLLLRYDVTGRVPTIKQLPWLPEKPIASMCFDPTLTWLLIATQTSQEIYIIPALSLVDSEAVVNQLFQTDDVTLRSFHCTTGNVCSALWWHTLDGRQIAIVATDVGEIVFVDLMTENEAVVKVTIDVTVVELSLSPDDLQMYTNLLITTVTGNQWRLLLETRTNVASFSLDSTDIMSEMGYDNIDGRAIPPRTILDSAEENSPIFAPVQFQSFHPPTLLKPQYARGRHFITAHCKSSCTLQVLDSDAEHSPLFVYKLPGGTDSVILTDRLMFAMIRDSRDRKLMILSNQKSENLVDDPQEYMSDAIVQEFTFPEGEMVLGVERKRYPFYFHEHHENKYSRNVQTGSLVEPNRNVNTYLGASVLSIPVTTHTVLDGCVIVTNCAVYEVRPRISPERLFLYLALTMPETTQAEKLAISVGLDLTSLSEMAAEHMLQQCYFAKAMKLYTLSKIRLQCPATKRTGGLARHGCISETMIHLRQVLSSPGFELNTSERKFLSNMLLCCFVYQLNSRGQAAVNIHAGLGDFLFGSFSFDEHMALTLLADFGEVELLMTLAKARGLVVDALRSLVSAQAFTDIPLSILSDLVQRGFSVHLLQGGKGSLLPCMAPEDLVKLVITRPQLAIQNVSSVLHPLLPIMQPQQLLELARIFDPSKSVMRGTLLRMHTARRRTNSLTSLCSAMSEAVDGASNTRDIRMSKLVEFFLLVVLHLNYHRRLASSDKQSLDLASLVGNSATEAACAKQEGSCSEFHQLSLQCQPVSCGPKHSAIIRNGDLYTWGSSLQGRLGHGDVPHAVCSVARVETLHMLRLRVDSVACGMEHTLALTQHGVYGWGSSKYGQVGVGMCHIYKRPMLLETMQSEMVVAVDCGLYHSLALTSDHQVYSWGWGVHGQLGHGNIEDCLVPTHIRDLLNMAVTKVAGGYGHSVVLTESGEVWTFGCGYFGQLGHGTNVKVTRPQRVKSIDIPVTTIATKYFQSIAVTISNKVYVWGCHPHNMRQMASAIRHGKTSGRFIPEQTFFMSPSVLDTTYVHGKIVKACCGSLHGALVTEDGTLYVWGRNLEGQLGTGTRQDERVPKMLASTGDHVVVAAASGGEFTMVMESEGDVWLWGKNDFGQLGFVKTRRELHQGTKVAGGHLFRNSNIHTQSQELNTPTELKGLPLSDTNDEQWTGFLASLSCDGDWSEDQEENSENILHTLPDLDKLGTDIYDSCVVPITLKTLGTFCESSFCLQKSVDLGDWLTAGHICCLEENFTQALYYRLRAVAEGMEQLSQDDIISLCVQLVSHHIKQLNEKSVPSSNKGKDLQQLCSHALHFWCEHRLPQAYLESIFSDHIHPLLPWLVQVVLRRPSGETAVSSTSSQCPLSNSFALRVIKCAMEARSVSSQDRILDMSWQSALRGKQTSQPPLRHGIQTRDKLTPKDRLWADILKNIKKDPGEISLTHSHMEYLEHQDRRSQDPLASSQFVVFTCGHHFPAENFRSEAVSSLTLELSSSLMRLPRTSSLLKDLLTRPGLIPSACPKCILHGLAVR